MRHSAGGVMKLRWFATILVLIFAWGASSAWAINIVLDYSDDSFFAAHPTAMATLNAAAQYISSLLTTPLNATTDTSTANVNGSTATFDFNYSITNPTTGATQTIDPAVLAANQVRIYVGVQKINSGGEAGVGGPGGAGVNASVSYFNQTDLNSAFNNAQTAANANMGRGGGPTIGKLSGNLNGSFGTLPFSINYGASVGSIWFDVDTNNDGVVDTDAQLNNYWQFDYTKPVGANQTDFYSVAMHEILHSLGFGTAQSWKNDIPSGAPQSWLGSQVISLVGTGQNVLGPDGEHASSSLLSTRLTDGGVQQAIMSPTITTGTRKGVTRLDLAFLRDMGWSTIAYPFLPGDFNQDNHLTVADVSAMTSALTNLSGYESAHSLSATDLLTIGDLNGDHVVNNADLQGLLNLLVGGGGGALQSVPEPGSFLLLGCGGALLVSWPRLRRRTCNASNRNVRGHAEMAADDSLRPAAFRR
jgi:hypothetical protein